MRFKIDWASLMVGSKFTIFALFYFVFESKFSKHGPPEGLCLKGRFNRGFFRVTGLRGLYLEGLIFGILRYILAKSEEKGMFSQARYI